MSIVRAGIYSAFATAARLSAGLVVVKLVAWFAGPEGVGKMGQFMSMMSLLAVLAGGGVASGITKYVAEFGDEPERLRRLIGAGLFYAGCASLLVGVLTLCFRETLAVRLLGDARYEPLICVLAVGQAMIALHNYFVAVINGFMDVRRVAMIHIVGAVVNIAITALLAWQFRLYGALMALVVGQSALMFVSFAMLYRGPHFSWHLLRPRYDASMFKRLSHYSAMTVTSALLPPVVNIWVRDHLAARFSWEQVGYWQAVSKVSEAYLLFLTMAINMYYLPKLSSIKERPAFVAELRSAYRHILPVVVILAFFVYLMRDWVTLILFSGSFVSAAPLYAPQLVGDVIKIAAYVLSYIMLAKSMVKAFLFSELLFSASYVVLVYLFVEHFGLIGTMYAFAVNYAAYFVYTYFVARWYIGQMD